LTATDVLDFSTDIGTSLEGTAESANTDVNQAGGWHYADTFFTYWNGDAAQTGLC
jgi:hypothetical protein